MKKILQVKNFFLPLFLFIATLSTYIHNLSPSVYGGDVGDFLIAVVTRGIAHPSGYPLFVIVGILFNALPIDQTPAWKVGLISALFSSLAVVIMYYIVLEVLQKKILAVITALSLAFVYTFWLYAEVAEAFALNNFFELLLLLLAILYFKRKKILFLYLLSFFAGLALTNHEIIVALFPSLLLLIFRTNWKIIKTPSVLLKCMGFFILGLLPYLYLPVVASGIPDTIFGWGKQFNIGNILRHILRLDYSWNLNTQQNITRVLPLLAYVAYWLKELPFIVVICCGIGSIFLLFRKNTTIFFAITLAVLLTGPGYVLYGSTPVIDTFTQGVLERFYGISVLFFLILLPYGIECITQSIIPLVTVLYPKMGHKQHYKSIFVFPFLCIPIYLFFHNYQATDLHAIWIGDTFAKDLLSPLPQNSTLIVNGDTPIFNTIYIQQAFNFRKDVRVLVSENSFLSDLEFKRKKEEIHKESEELSSIETDIKVLTSLSQHRPIFSTQQFQYQNKKRGKINWMPYGIVHKMANTADLELSKDEFLALQKKIWNTYRISNNTHSIKQIERSLTLSEIPYLYAGGSVKIGNYLISWYHDPVSKDYYQKAIDLVPNTDAGYEEMGFYYINRNDCKNAATYFQKTIEQNPGRRNPYVMLYTIHSSCIPNKEAAKKISKEFSQVFHLSINDFVSIPQ